MGWMTDNLGESLPQYRLYCLDGQGKIVSSHTIYAPDDNAALEFGKDYCKRYKIDLWQGERWVGQADKVAA